MEGGWRFLSDFSAFTYISQGERVVNVEEEQETALDHDPHTLTPPQRTLRSPGLCEPETSEQVEHVQPGVNPKDTAQPARFLYFRLRAVGFLHRCLFPRRCARAKDGNDPVNDAPCEELHGESAGYHNCNSYHPEGKKE